MIQSILFDKKLFSSNQAKSWLKQHNYVHSKEHVTETYRRFRQVDPERFTKFRKLSIFPGIVFVLGFWTFLFSNSHKCPTQICKFLQLLLHFYDFLQLGFNFPESICRKFFFVWWHFTLTWDGTCTILFHYMVSENQNVVVRGVNATPNLSLLIVRSMWMHHFQANSW